VVTRVYILNNQSAQTHVSLVQFDGADAKEYKISNNQGHYYPLQNFQLNPHDTMWVDVVFKADITKTGAALYANRHARLLAVFESTSGESDSTAIDFTDKVRHAALSITPSLLDLGTVAINSLTPGFVTLTNSGDAPYVIAGISFPNPPIKAILAGANPLKVGDTVYPGQSLKVEIDNQLNSYTDTTVSYYLSGNKICSGSDTGNIHIAVANASLQVASTGFSARPTFIGGCREDDSVITASNTGVAPVKLVSVELTGTAANPDVSEFFLLDAGGKKTKVVTFDSILQAGTAVKIPIVYLPTKLGLVSAAILYHWDSAGASQFTTANVAFGTGVQLHTAVSVAQAGGAPYTADPQGVFEVPVTLAAPALPGNGDARRITFRLSYKQDVIQFLRGSASGAYSLANPAPLPVDLGGGYEALDFDVTSNAPMTNLDEVMRVKFQVMVAKDTTTPFTLSNIQFYDAKNTPICYIVTDTIAGAFISNAICGSASLRQFLLGKFQPARITALIPNIVDGSQTPILTYRINQDGIAVKVEVFNVLGERVNLLEDQSQPVGEYALPITTRNLPSGTYLVRLSTSQTSEIIKFMMRK
jgi:hypothetical protein